MKQIITVTLYDDISARQSEVVAMRFDDPSNAGISSERAFASILQGNPALQDCYAEIAYNDGSKVVVEPPLKAA